MIYGCGNRYWSISRSDMTKREKKVLGFGVSYIKGMTIQLEMDVAARAKKQTK